jgi:hypothetical protein
MRGKPPSSIPTFIIPTPISPTPISPTSSTHPRLALAMLAVAMATTGSSSSSVLGLNRVCDGGGDAYRCCIRSYRLYIPLRLLTKATVSVHAVPAHAIRCLLPILIALSITTALTPPVEGTMLHPTLKLLLPPLRILVLALRNLSLSSLPHLLLGFLAPLIGCCLSLLKWGTRIEGDMWGRGQNVRGGR